MLLTPSAEGEIVKALEPLRDSIQPAFTYLANTIAVGDREIPYSTVRASIFSADAPLGPFCSEQGDPLPPLGPNEIALNVWAAEQLHAAVGDAVQIKYFEPESIEGQVREKTVVLHLAAVVKTRRRRSGPVADAQGQGNDRRENDVRVGPAVSIRPRADSTGR